MGSRWNIQLGDFVRSISDGLYGFVTSLSHNYNMTEGIRHIVGVDWFMDDGTLIRDNEIDILHLMPVSNEERVILGIMNS